MVQGAHGVPVAATAARVGLLVVVPALAHLDVADRELPALGRVVEAVLQALALLVLRDVEQELQDHGAGLGQHPFEVVDVVVALAGLRRRQRAGDHRHQHVLVVAPVEDHDLAGRRAPSGGCATGSRARAPPRTAPSSSRCARRARSSRRRRRGSCRPCRSCRCPAARPAACSAGPHRTAPAGRRARSRGRPWPACRAPCRRSRTACRPDRIATA